MKKIFNGLKAPVLINGTRGNVSVVVKKGGKNKYKTHKILMPDGSEFIFETKKDIEPTSAGVKGENHRQGPAISSMSNNSISENDEIVKVAEEKRAQKAQKPLDTTELEALNQILHHMNFVFETYGKIWRGGRQERITREGSCFK